MRKCGCDLRVAVDVQDTYLPIVLRKLCSCRVLHGKISVQVHSASKIPAKGRHRVIESQSSLWSEFK
jgi:hypothetical protein